MEGQRELRSLEDRVARLDDPIPRLHPDVPEVGQRLYEAAALKDPPSGLLDLSDAFCTRYRRALARLEAEGYIGGTHAIGGQRFVGGVRIAEPMFLIYLAALHEDVAKASAMAAHVDSAETGKWLDGYDIARQLGVPWMLVAAVFDAYETRGLGMRSKTIGVLRYRPLA
jgi:hypothetical protein